MNSVERIAVERLLQTAATHIESARNLASPSLPLCDKLDEVRVALDHAYAEVEFEKEGARA